MANPRNREKVIGIRVTEKEYQRLEVQAKNRGMSVVEFIRDMALNDGCSLLQIRMLLSNMDNTLSNILLGEKIISANMTEMFRNLSTRVKEKDVSKISPEEADRITKGIENSIHKVKSAAMDAVFTHYTEADKEDPLSLDVFAKKIEEL